MRDGFAQADAEALERVYRALEDSGQVQGRPAQKDLTWRMLDALRRKVCLIAEAPTGTGKTIAYLTALAARLQQDENVTMVVATATAALQGQVLLNDVPKLVNANLIDERVVALAKGRGRYYCPLAAERILNTADGAVVSAQTDFFDENAGMEFEDRRTLQSLQEKFVLREWNGDVDSLSEKKISFWDKVQASSDTCVRNQCQYYDSCPFFAARRRMAQAKLIVANHDLVLADLQMRAAKKNEDGSVTASSKDGVIPASKYIVVFDEAHHLPNKAQDQAVGEYVEDSLIQGLKAGELGRARMWKHHELVALLERKGIDRSAFDNTAVLQAKAALTSACRDLEIDEEFGYLRFENSAVPAPVWDAARDLANVLTEHAKPLQAAVSALRNSNLVDRNPNLRPVLAESLMRLAALHDCVARPATALNRFVHDDPSNVRWMTRDDKGQISLLISPAEGDQVLKDLLWSQPEVQPLMISATLQDVDGFSRFRERAGAPENAETFAMASDFPYKESFLYFHPMRFSPRQETRAQWEAELERELPTTIDPEEGTLVLCSSWDQLRRIQALLKADRRFHVLAQGERSVAQLVQAHRERIDNGRGSVLVGVATMAEGLDLPGDYCTHVLILTLPFAVPTSPVEREMESRMGEEYFTKRLVPDAFVKLVQMTGRLMRRPTDRGRITVFDQRLFNKPWGRRMLNNLPPFTRRYYASTNPKRPPPTSPRRVYRRPVEPDLPSDVLAPPAPKPPAELPTQLTAWLTQTISDPEIGDLEEV